MRFNIDFEVMSLITLIIVSAVLQYKHHALPTQSNRVFTILLGVGIADVVLDLISTMFIAYPEYVPMWLQSSGLHLFYIMQLLMPFIFFCYEISLRGFRWKENSAMMCLFSLPFVFMLIMVAINPITGFIVSFRGGVYTRESMYPFMYIYALVYLVATLFDTFIYKKRLKRRDIMAIRCFMLMNIVTVLIQLFLNNVLLTGVGIALSLTLLLITVNNPFEKTDTLTGLFDQSGLREAITERIRLKQDYMIIAVLFEGIKTINSVFGLGEGNSQLKLFAKLLEDAVDHENAFRFVGNRFIALCTEDNYREALGKINKYFEITHRINNVDMLFPVYICSVPDTERYQSAESIVDFTEYMLQKIKEQDEGFFIEATHKDEEKYARRKEIENYLYKAIKEELFDVNFQPVYSLSAKRFTSIEALARLIHPTLGNVPPAEFISIAERGGLITQLERCILKKVCEFIRDNPDIETKLDNVKINHSPASFLNVYLAKETVATIKEYGLDNSFFQFEITENLAGKYDSNIIEWAKAIKESGSGLCLDDFGSGYANIDSVMQLPFDVVKFDRSMLMEAQSSERSQALYRDTAAAMLDLGYTVVAEGAESKQDIDLLKSFGVNYIQGYYYSKPLKPEELIELLK